MEKEKNKNEGKMNRMKLLSFGGGAAIILFIVFGGFFIGRYFRPSNIVADKSQLYSANQVSLKAATADPISGRNTYFQARYKPVNSTKWAETEVKLGITADAAASQSFDVANLKTATTYEYQTKQISEQGQAKDWGKSVIFATARDAGVKTIENPANVAYTSATDFNNPGDITFDGKVDGADYYVWDFGDNQKSGDLVGTARTNHIYEIGGTYLAVMTGYKYVPEASNIFNKQTKYSGQAIVGQKVVNFYVNLPEVEVALGDDGSATIGPVSSNTNASLDNIAAAQPDQAVLGVETTKTCKLNFETFKSEWPTQIEAGKTVVSNIPYAKGSKVVVKLDDELIKRGECYFRIGYGTKANQLKLNCKYAANGVMTVQEFTSSKDKTSTCAVTSVNVEVKGTEKKCEYTAWVMQDGKCQYLKNQCSARLDQCKCGITKLSAHQDAVNPLKYTFTIAVPEGSTAKSFKVDFGDTRTEIFKAGATITHTYIEPGQKKVKAYSYTEETPGENPCGSSVTYIHPLACSITKAFGADVYSGVLSPADQTAGKKITVNFTMGVIADQPPTATLYRITYGDGTDSGNTPLPFKDIAKHDYATPGNYLPKIEGFNNSLYNCGSTTLNAPIIITGAIEGATCSIGTLTAAPTSGEATPAKPLAVTFTTDVLIPATGQQKATLYELDYGDGSAIDTQKAGEVTIAIVPAPIQTLTFKHSYKGPNVNPGLSAAQNYTATLRAYRLENDQKIDCGSVATKVQITTPIPTPVGPTVVCRFAGTLKATPTQVTVGKEVTITSKATSAPRPQNGAYQTPTSWKYSFGETVMKDFTGSIDELNKNKVTYIPTANGTYPVVLRGYYTDSVGGTIDCGSIATAIPVEVTGGQSTNANIAEVTVTPPVVSTPRENVYATVSGIDKIDYLVVDWGDGKTEKVSVSGKTKTKLQHRYDNQGAYTVDVSGFKSNLEKLFGKFKKSATVGKNKPDKNAKTKPTVTPATTPSGTPTTSPSGILDPSCAPVNITPGLIPGSGYSLSCEGGSTTPSKWENCACYITVDPNEYYACDARINSCGGPPITCDGTNPDGTYKCSTGFPQIYPNPYANCDQQVWCGADKCAEYAPATGTKCEPIIDPFGNTSPPPISQPVPIAQNPVNGACGTDGGCDSGTRVDTTGSDPCTKYYDCVGSGSGASNAIGCEEKIIRPECG